MIALMALCAGMHKRGQFPVRRHVYTQPDAAAYQDRDNTHTHKHTHVLSLSLFLSLSMAPSLFNPSLHPPSLPPSSLPPSPHTRPRSHLAQFHVSGHCPKQHVRQKRRHIAVASPRVFCNRLHDVVHQRHCQAFLCAHACVRACVRAGVRACELVSCIYACVLMAA